MPLLRDYLKNKGNTLCGYDSDLIWGRLPFLHWVADLKGWVDEMTRGDGYWDPKMVRPKGLTELEIKMGDRPPILYQPYASMLRELRKQKAEILEFSYDWRLAAHANVEKLQQGIIKRWWNEKPLDKAIKDHERLLVIGHSLGGLIARLFIEDPKFLGSKLVRHAILVATPNKGSPNAFAYLTETKRFFQDMPGWQVIDALQRWKNDPKSKDSIKDRTFDASLYDPQLMAEHDDKRLVECFASIIQLLPTYDFVLPLGNAKGSERQKYTETYGKLPRHQPSKKTALAILEELDGPLLDGWALDAWLTRFDIIYDVVGATKLDTNVEMAEIPKKPRYKMIPKRDGDKTVPSYSSVGWVDRKGGYTSIMAPRKITNKSTDRYDDKKEKESTKERKKDYRVHAELCRHSEVIKLCTDRFKQAQKNKPPNKSRLTRGVIENYRAVAREIFLSGKTPFAVRSVMKNRTKVICYALVDGVNPRELMIDIRTEKVNGQLRLSNPPKGVAIPAIVYEGRAKGIKYQFVELAPVSHTRSGILFLPQKGEGFLHLFCIIAAPWEKLKCDNEGHAEMQFHHWLKAQQFEREWHTKIEQITLWNESLISDKFAYSPCRQCCGDLASLWKPKSCKARWIVWRTPYITTQCRNSTTTESIKILKAAGWSCHGPDPIDLPYHLLPDVAP